FAQLQNLAAGGLDQCPRLDHEVAMLGVHRACSRGFERPNELQWMNGYFGSLVAAKTTPLSSSLRGAPRDARGPRCRDPGPWPGFRFRGNERSFAVRISRTERDRLVERAHGLLPAAFSTVGGAPEQI